MLRGQKLTVVQGRFGSQGSKYLSKCNDGMHNVQVVHTGKHVEGQIYIPEVNWALCILGLVAVAGFRSTSAIGYAFSEYPCLQISTAWASTCWDNPSIVNVT
jgi:hypothetical protein